MVKITNDFGEVKKGRAGGMVYQTLYGRQIRRLAGSSPSTSSPLQDEIKNNFRDAVAWLQSLSPEEITEIKEEWQVAKNQDPEGTPINWWNFGKQKYMEVIYSPPAPVPVEDLLYFDKNYFDKNYFE